MLGTIVNAVAIIVGAIVGVFLKKGIPEGYKATIINGLGLSVLVIGLSGALGSQDILLMIASVVIGTILGEALKIEKGLENIGYWIENKAGSKEGGIAKGFITASLVFCIGAMAVMGALESGLTGNHETLFAKALIDGIMAAMFASTLGIGVAFSGAAVFVYQGLITLTASFMKPFLIESVITEMSAIGGLLIMGIGINVLEIKKIRVGNMLPAVFIPILYYILRLYIL
ncbi:DUF554 domain-containing protein [Alkaliphilus oremlandii]|uniref:Transport protein n=1 Tax=Alkaliphilus oremlandii (strain OhILAs) TaxID=350688 RepID=A8MJJ9_ALKOO|nr:DUF554 domain-containing protein [Alkaliphilus oremlandii]ABW19981.1 protein of unknown function DUF554 [Alkaliphilus oremlandii OhILAs]